MRLGIVFNKRYSDDVSGFIVRDTNRGGTVYRWYINGESGVESDLTVAKFVVNDLARKMLDFNRLVGCA